MQKLSDEAGKIYFAVFKAPIPEKIKDHFNHVSGKIDSVYSEDDATKYYHYLSCVNDLEALEVAARHLGRLPILTEKFKVMIYISEAFPENYHLFVNEYARRLSGYFSLLFSGFRSAYKLLKGMILLAIY